MPWNLFIDDERDPIDVKWGTWQEQAMYRDGEWVIARDWYEVLELVVLLGFPDIISFDHDLGDGTLNGYEIAKKLTDLIVDAGYVIPENFQFFVHSKNPVGAENIRIYMKNFITHNA
jgi:hypothetical protein